MNTFKQNKILFAIAILVGFALLAYLIDFFAMKLFLLIITACGIYILYLLQNRHTEKALNEQREFYQLKLDMIRSSLDPHFLFNAFSTITFSMRKNDTDTAISNLSNASKLMRTSFGSIDKFGHQLNEELEFIKNYLTLEKYRFDNKFDYSIKVMPYVNDMNKVPCFSIFCLVENALKKGILIQETSGKLTVNIDESQTNRMLIVRVTDDGLYRDFSNPENVTHNIKVVNELINKLNDINGQKIVLNCMPNTDKDNQPHGCIFELKIPLEYNYNLTPIQS